LPDDPELFDGAPVALQIVCRKFEEEKALAIAKELYSAFVKSEK
jgi:Asp-tRNA(Asn)/Glu-tRNA(Gln) amidotransferase A subunit family amidase